MPRWPHLTQETLQWLESLPNSLYLVDLSHRDCLFFKHLDNFLLKISDIVFNNSFDEFIAGKISDFYVNKMNKFVSYNKTALFLMQIIRLIKFNVKDFENIEKLALIPGQPNNKKNQCIGVLLFYAEIYYIVR